MNMIWLCIASVLSMASVASGHDIRVFPAANRSIAGVFQVSSLNDLSHPEYAFNASEARTLCSSLGVSIATKAQVQEALRRGLETCRFGWIDEHLAVIPRVKALSNCGKSQTGLVSWRASVTKRFDVFCFNETDAETQLKDTTTNSPVSSRDYTGQTASTHAAAAAERHSPSSSSLQPSSSSSSSAKPTDTEAEAARHTGSTKSSSGGKAVLITSTCALLLTTIIIIVYFKLKRINTEGFDVEKQQESIETEDWTCDKSVNKTPEDDKKTQVDDSDAE
uniref:lymphatic vessel endothelial hyaluronic acid receptor 1a n=1 Tax=Solea senegalensis TaxID=28829 RepID=UPI001CD8AD37|nr:lymphatic vessel endothelial hyaluronic acid receptor 1a [Solea senegalensis]